MRRPGRPRQQPAADARERLLDAGLQVLIDHGANALTLAATAKRAGLTAALLHYYFDAKPGLLKVLAEERVLPVIDALARAVDTDADTPVRLAHSFVDAVFAQVEHHTWLPALWAREILAGDGALRALLLQPIAARLPQPLAQRFAAAQAQGQLDARLDPRLLMISLVGLSLFPLAAQPMWSAIFPDPGLGRERLRQHTLALVQAALSPRESASS